MGVVVFRRLELEILNLERQIVECKSDEDTVSRLRGMKSALEEINSYMLSFGWLTHAKTKERVRTFIDTSYNYVESAKILNVESRSSFETSIWYTSKKFEERIGVDTLKLILDGRVDEGLRQFRVGTGNLSLSTLIPDGVVSHVPKSKYNGLISPSACGKELRLLKNLTSKKIEAAIQSRNEDNIYFIRYIL